jgi:hypothetical protein
MLVDHQLNLVHIHIIYHHINHILYDYILTLVYNLVLYTKLRQYIIFILQQKNY